MDQEVLHFLFADDRRTPNHPTLPLIVVRQALGSGKGVSADCWEAQFRKNGWGGTWRWGVYSFHHFHSTAHEVLGVACGSAYIQFGGESPVGRYPCEAETWL